MPAMRMVVGPMMTIAGVNPNHVEHGVANATLGTDHVGECSYRLRRSAQHDGDEAVIVIEMGERGRGDDVVVGMLHLRQTRWERPDPVIEDIGQAGDTHRLNRGQRLLVLKGFAHQIAYPLGAAEVTASAETAIHLASE